MTISDGLLICVTFAGPVVAVQLTRYLDDVRAVRSRKVALFKKLMATRAYTLSLAHVEALNSIDLEFSANNRKEKRVIEAWRAYLDLLGTKVGKEGLPEDQWNTKSLELRVELLSQMGQALGYDFDRTQIKNAAYSPVRHGQIEEQQEAIRRGVVDMMEGRRGIPVYNMPPAGKLGR